MRYVTAIIKNFTFITTGIVILFIILMLIQGDDAVTLTTLIEIPCAALATSVVTVLLYPVEAKTKWAYRLRMLLHYLALCIVMIIMGILFGWIGFKIPDILLMMLSVAAIYAFTFTVTFITLKNDADELNRVLKNKQSKS